MADNQSSSELGVSEFQTAGSGGPFAVMVYLLLLALFFVIPLSRISHSPEPPYLTANYSPLGYTFSLAFFLMPCVTTVPWFFQHRHLLPNQWRAFKITLAIVVTMWSLLDILLGNIFFRFPNPGATLGVFAPGYVPGQGWPRTIPIEEFAFYGLGSAAILLGYIWGCQTWLSAYTPPVSAYMARAREVPKLVVIHIRPLAAGALVFLLALAWKKLGPHEYRAGFPGYFLFELALVVGPIVMLSHVVHPMINSAALVAQLMALFFIGLLWEVTLALPYGYWGYQHDAMIGILITPWFDLPIEAFVLWPAAVWTNIYLYETARLYALSQRPLLNLLFGAASASPAAT